MSRGSSVALTIFDGTFGSIGKAADSTGFFFHKLTRRVYALWTPGGSLANLLLAYTYHVISLFQVSARGGAIRCARSCPGRPRQDRARARDARGGKGRPCRRQGRDSRGIGRSSRGFGLSWCLVGACGWIWRARRSSRSAESPADETMFTCDSLLRGPCSPSSFHHPGLGPISPSLASPGSLPAPPPPRSRFSGFASVSPSPPFPTPPTLSFRPPLLFFLSLAISLTHSKLHPHHEGPLNLDG